MFRNGVLDDHEIIPITAPWNVHTTVVQWRFQGGDIFLMHADTEADLEAGRTTVIGKVQSLFSGEYSASRIDRGGRAKDTERFPANKRRVAQLHVVDMFENTLLDTRPVPLLDDYLQQRDIDPDDVTGWKGLYAPTSVYAAIDELTREIVVLAETSKVTLVPGSVVGGEAWMLGALRGLDAHLKKCEPYLDPTKCPGNRRLAQIAIWSRCLLDLLSVPATGPAPLSFTRMLWDWARQPDRRLEFFNGVVPGTLRMTHPDWPFQP